MEIKRAIVDKEVNTDSPEAIGDNVFVVEYRSIKPAPFDSRKCTASSDAEDKLTVTLIVIDEYSCLKKW